MADRIRIRDNYYNRKDVKLVNERYAGCHTIEVFQTPDGRTWEYLTGDRPNVPAHKRYTEVA